MIGQLLLLTNSEVIDVDQHSADNHLVSSTDEVVVCAANANSSSKAHYLAVFNISPEPQKLRFEWKQLGLGEAEYQVRDLWRKRDLGPAHSLELSLPSHGWVLYRVAAQ